MENKTAVITGASMGLGKYLAAECAKRGFDLLLIALPSTGLDQVAEVIRYRFDVNVYTVETDLSKDSSTDEIINFCRANQLQVSALVNNAGLGFEAGFKDLSIDFCTLLMKVNMLATVRISHAFLPLLMAQNSAYILNIGSLASFSPMPFKGLYAASKAFIRSFSVSLRSELKNSGISVSVICPGAVPTNDLLRQRIQNHGAFAKLMMYEPYEIATIAIKGMMDGKSVIVPGVLSKVSAIMMQSMPSSFTQSMLYRRYLSTANR